MPRPPSVTFTLFYREEGADILIVARTDARQAVSFEEALARALAFSLEGADVVFIDALESETEMRRLCDALPDTYKVSKVRLWKSVPL